MSTLSNVIVSNDINYIAVFLTFNCGYSCSYCINNHGEKPFKNRVQRMTLPKDRWILGLNRFKVSPSLPITIQGGEPTLYREFYTLLKEIKTDIPIDILTNLDFDVRRFMIEVNPKRIKRNAKYASIRASYHHSQTDFISFINKVKMLQDAGYHIGVFEINIPGYNDQVLYRQKVAKDAGIDWRIKEFLGQWNGKLHGTYRYKDAVDSNNFSHCTCRTTEILIDPSGFIYRCHSDLYAKRKHIAHILDENLHEVNFHEWRKCNNYGKCNACDIKNKTNRFQIYGHSSVDIKDISKPYNIV